ncbi:MAG: endonuclease III [Chloroflexi bacterium]|nr:endonuclease III [Chloroflexota bacterium]
MSSLVRWVHRRLLDTYGRPTWEPAYEPVEELVGTILSQHTSDVNSARAFASLRSRFQSWESVRDAPLGELTDAIRSGGLAIVKAQRIQAVLRALTGPDGNVELPDLRRMRRRSALDLLLALPGVGRKTAACVLLFGAHVPALPVDTHVHRVSLRLGLVPPRTTPEATSDRLEAELDPREYYAFHVNLIRLGREICRAPRPRCEVCPLRERCAAGRLTAVSRPARARARRSPSATAAASAGP